MIPAPVQVDDFPARARPLLVESAARLRRRRGTVLAAGFVGLPSLGLLVPVATELWFPNSVALTSIGGVAFWGSIVVMLLQVLRAILRPVSVEAAAIDLGRRYPSSREAWLSLLTVAGDPVSPARHSTLVDAIAEVAISGCRGRPRSVRHRWAIAAWTVAGVASSLVLGLVMLYPASALTGVRAAVMPWRSTGRASGEVRLQLPRDTVPRGAFAQLWVDSARFSLVTPVLSWRPVGSQQWRRAIPQPGGSPPYEFRFGPITSDTEAFVDWAGRTSRTVLLRCASVVTIEEAWVHVSPPNSKQPTTRARTELAAIEVPAGAEVILAVRFSRPVASAAAVLTGSEQRRIPLKRGADASSWWWKLHPRGDEVFQVDATTLEGLVVPGPPGLSFRVVADQPPLCVWLGARVRGRSADLDYLVLDDHNIDRVTVNRRLRGRSDIAVPVSATLPSTRVVGTITVENLAPGERVVLEAKDVQQSKAQPAVWQMPAARPRASTRP